MCFCIWVFVCVSLYLCICVFVYLYFCILICLFTVHRLWIIFKADTLFVWSLMLLWSQSSEAIQRSFSGRWSQNVFCRISNVKLSPSPTINFNISHQICSIQIWRDPHRCVKAVLRSDAILSSLIFVHLFGAHISIIDTSRHNTHQIYFTQHIDIDTGICIFSLWASRMIGGWSDSDGIHCIMIWTGPRLIALVISHHFWCISQTWSTGFLQSFWQYFWLIDFNILMHSIHWTILL